MHDHHVIVGAGPVGRHLAQLLASDGEEVAVVTRSGTDTGIPGVRHLALDAADADALAEVTRGAVGLYNCANPGNYTQWERVWPPVASALLRVAERTGAIYAVTGNLYPYGPVTVPMTEQFPDAATDHKGRLRAKMWADAKAAHEEGRIRAVEVRGSDYLGSGVGANGLITRLVPAALRGRRVSVLDDASQPHSFTDVLDVARTLRAAVRDDGALGRVWHVPSNPPRTQAEAINDVMASVGRPAVRVSVMPTAAMRTLGLVWPLARELHELAYQRQRPYILDDSAARARFKLEPTPWQEVCRRSAR